ncbi:alpha/beta fold hydrolase [Sinobaca sp. H24]|uniref:alpha/beta fold hydrolase n=1 Tax=Sinobaca sp. H24 TaxID=2923376 RepID=UPI00207A0C32|nr:alpha/beta fold hydrolase [Sinobaca sp. H24]
MAEMYDHNGHPVKHGRARVNGIRMHYVTAGKGEPLLLLHGTPKTHYYWYKLLPLLTEHFTVVAPDLRGFGDTDKPPAEEGYDSLTNANDMAELMTVLGHELFYLHGEDRGAEFAYALAASYPERVKALSFAEMLLSGQGLEEWSNFTPENVSAQYNLKGVWLWHIPFFWIPHIPEMLISGHEREFWEFWIKQETWNPNAITNEALDEWIAKLTAPGGLRDVWKRTGPVLRMQKLMRLS